jgi:hypothetical protein
MANYQVGRADHAGAGDIVGRHRMAFNREADPLQPLRRHLGVARAITRRIVRWLLHKRGKELDLLVEVIVDAVGQGRGKNVLGHVRLSR